MFNLELNISSWCDTLRLNDKLMEDDIQELESHLRDQIDDLIEKGLSEEEAFIISVKRLGHINSLSKEYSKVNTGNLWKHFFMDSFDLDTRQQRKKDIILIIILSLLSGTVAVLPDILGLNVESLTYFKNISLFILPFVALFLALKHNISKKLLTIVLGLFIITAVIINLYPSNPPRHTEILSAIHLPIMLWLTTGITYMGENWRSSKERMNFLRFTGESIIYGSLIMFGLLVLTMFIMVIFESISVTINESMLQYILIYGSSAAAIITMYLVETKKSIVENFAPILAKIFSPLLLIIMITFLIVMLITGNSPFYDRNFLIAFDLMLILVLGMVIYIISARNIHQNNNFFDYLNVVLILSAIIIDAIALIAIVFRLTEYGITPNKLAALGENILLFINLGGLLWIYLKYFLNKTEFISIENWQTKYLTIYALWMAIVVFVFSIIFNFN